MGSIAVLYHRVGRFRYAGDDIPACRGAGRNGDLHDDLRPDHGGYVQKELIDTFPQTARAKEE